MSERIVIEVDAKSIRTSKKNIVQLHRAVIETDDVLDNLNKVKVLPGIAEESNKFFQTLEKMNRQIKKLENGHLLTFYTIKSSIDRLVDGIYLKVQSFIGQTFKICIRIDDRLALKQVKRLNNELNNISGTIGDNTRGKSNQQPKIQEVGKNKNAYEEQRTAKRKNVKDKVEDIKKYFYEKKQGFKDDPIGTTFSTAIEGIDYVGRGMILRDGVKKLKGSKLLKKNNNNSSSRRLAEGDGKNAKTGKRFFSEDSKIRKSAKEFVKEKTPMAKERIRNFGSDAKHNISSGGKAATKALKNVGSGAKRLAASGAGKLGAGAAIAGKKVALVGTQVISKLGVAGTAGAAVTVMGVADGAKDLYKGYKADNDYDKKYETTKGASKIGATLTGAAVGTAILPGVGTLFGSAIGYLFGKFGGEKLGERAAGGAEGAAKYANRSENAAIKVAEDSALEFEKYRQQAAGAQTQEERDQLLSGFLDKMDGTTKALEALAEKNKKEGKEAPEEVADYLMKIETLKALSGGSTLPQGGQPYQAKIVTDKNLIPPLGQKGFSVQEGAQSPIPTELQIDGNKVINGQSPITPEELGVPPFISTTVDVYIKENKIIGDPPKDAKGVGSTLASAGYTVMKGANKALKNLNQFRGGIVGGSIPGFAEGGYVQGGAQLITVAEEGTPEAIIPLGKHRRKRAMELFSQVGSYLQAPGFSPKGFAAGGIVGGSIGSGFGGGMPAVVEVGGVEIKVEAKDGQNLVETIRDHKEEISEEIAGVFNAAFKGQFANTPASGGVSA